MTKTCSISGCDGEYLAKGLCRKHYYDRRKARKQQEALEKETASRPEFSWIDTADRDTLMQQFLLRVMGWYPPNHPMARQYFFRQHPERKIYRPGSYEWFDGEQMRYSFFSFDGIARLTHQRLTPEQWRSFSLLVLEAVDVILMTPKEIEIVMLRVALRMYLSSQPE